MTKNNLTKQSALFEKKKICNTYHMIVDVKGATGMIWNIKKLTALEQGIEMIGHSHKKCLCNQACQIDYLYRDLLKKSNECHIELFAKIASPGKNYEHYRAENAAF